VSDYGLTPTQQFFSYTHKTKDRATRTPLKTRDEHAEFFLGFLASSLK